VNEMNGERAIATLPNEPCTLIEAYLNGELAGEMANLFEGHLTGCAGCSESVEQQRWIDGLLRSSEAALLEAAPANIAVRVEGKVVRLRSRRMVGLAMMAAAASIAAVALWHFTNQRSVNRMIAAPGSARGSNQQAAVQREATPRQSRGLHRAMAAEKQAMFVSTGDAIAVPVASDDAQVSIVKVYPTTIAERRWRRELTLNAGRAGQDGG
jgi:hypothetical protein